MKKLLLLLPVCLALKTGAQFTILNPGIPVQTIEDIKTDTNGHAVFGTNNGILIYHDGAWQHFGLSSGLTQLDVKAIGMYDNGFFYSAASRRIGNCNYTSLIDTVFSIADTFNFISAININTTGDTLYGSDSGEVYLNPGIHYGHLSFGPLGRVTDIGQLHNLSGTVDFHVIATTDKAVIYQVSTSTAVIIAAGSSPLPSNNILSHTVNGAITYDGTDRGLYIADFTNYPSVPSSVVNKTNAAIPSDTISAIAVKDSTIFIGTPKGLSILLNGHWRTYDSTNSNLPSSEIARLALDSSSLWIGTKRGDICRLGIAQITEKVAETHPAMGAYSVYPDPADEYVQVNSHGMVNGRFLLYDMSGRKIAEEALQGSSEKIAVGMYPQGVYHYCVIAGSGLQLFSGKLLIEH